MVNIIPRIIFSLTYFIYLTDAVNPACECVVYQSYGGSQGRFTSPNFPEIYPSNINCILYTFIGDLGEIIELTFLEFDLKMPVKSQCKDFLRFFLDLDRAEVNQYSSWNYELCGNNSMIQKKHFSKGRSLIIEFHSDSSPGNHTGFKGIFRFMDQNSRLNIIRTPGRPIVIHPGQFQIDGIRKPGTSCIYHFHSSNRTKMGRFFSPRYPQNYPPGVSCQYLFQGLPGEKVRIEFQNIQLYHVDMNCQDSSDAVVVHDGKDVEGTVIGTFCDVHNNQIVTSSGHFLYIDFYSDDKNERQGFAATFKFFIDSPIPETSPDSSSFTRSTATEILIASPQTTMTPSLAVCNKRISSIDGKNGTITSPSYPKPYPGDITCKYTFEGSGSERIQLRFTHMDLYYPVGNPDAPNNCQRSDSVTITIYINGEATDLNTYCGRKLPPMLMSNEQRMTVLFRSVQYSSTVTGFRADYQFVKNFGITSGESDRRYLCGFSYKSVLAPSGTFTSPNYPGLYPKNTECHYLFYGRKGEKVRLQFEHFDLDGILRCEEKTQSDYVAFSNFFTTMDRKMERFCGNRSGKNNTIISDGEFFKVIFKSNEVYDATGFEATYQFISIPGPSGKQSDIITSSSISQNGCRFSAQLELWTSISCVFVLTML